MYTGCSSGLLSRAVAWLSATSHPRQARYTRAHACALTPRSIPRSVPSQTPTCTRPSQRSGPGWGISEVQEPPASPPDLSLRQRGRRTGDFPTGGDHTRPTGHPPAPSQTFCVVPSPGTKAYAQSPGADSPSLLGVPAPHPSHGMAAAVGPGQTGKSSRQPGPGALSHGSARAAGLPCVWMELLLPLCRGRGERQSPSVGHDPGKAVPRSPAPRVGGTRRQPSPGASCRHRQRPPRGRGRR